MVAELQSPWLSSSVFFAKQGFRGTHVHLLKSAVWYVSVLTFVQYSDAIWRRNEHYEKITDTSRLSIFRSACRARQCLISRRRPRGHHAQTTRCDRNIPIDVWATARPVVTV